MEKVAGVGGAEGPFELILEFIGGRYPQGEPWNYIRSWRWLSRAVSLAWMQYNRDIETIGPNKGLM